MGSVCSLDLNQRQAHHEDCHYFCLHCCRNCCQWGGIWTLLWKTILWPPICTAEVCEGCAVEGATDIPAILAQDCHAENIKPVDCHPDFPACHEPLKDCYKTFPRSKECFVGPGPCIHEARIAVPPCIAAQETALHECIVAKKAALAAADKCLA